ncbi:MAG: hypothetical protein J5497_04470 [Selenomonadaceae bacterium]|nr:hypothetical protein [Selenomonadaceae bacterium]
MSFVTIRPITEEQKREREAKKAAQEAELIQIGNDLIIADLLEKIAKLEADINDRD